MDGAAQAGMILAGVERLATLERYLIVAKFARQGVACACGSACCSGERKNPQWVEAIDRLTGAVLAVLPGVSHYRLRRAMVEKYFVEEYGGGSMSLKGIANACGVARNTVSAQHAKVRKALESADRRGWLQIKGWLEAAGVVERG